MGLQTCLVLILLSVYLVFTSPVDNVCRWRNQTCPKCPPGEYQTQCKCAPCPSGTYTFDNNCEASCHRCYSDCRSDLNLKVVQNCTSRSNLKCECQSGFVCTNKERLSGNCRHCQKIHDTATTGQRTTTTQPCNFPKCSSEQISGNTTDTPNDTTKNQLITILCPLVVIVLVPLMILFYIGCQGEETCLKQTVKKLCNLKVRDTTHKPGDMFCSKHHSVPMATANMGPVHVHNPGTVIFSLLSQFTGQTGPTKEEKIDVKGTDEDEIGCHVCQPTSPGIHLSEEEHRGEMDSVFFPSQEQGKDCRVSKEEEL